jgi:hypothetical protein
MTTQLKSSETYPNTNISREKNFLLLISLPLFVSLHNFNEYRDLLFTSSTVALILCWFTVPFITLFSVRTVSRLNNQQSLLVTFYLSSCFFFFGVLQDFLHSNIPIRFFSKSYFLVPLLLLLAIACYRSIKKIETKNTAGYLNKLMLLLVLYEAFVLCGILIDSRFYSDISKTFKHESLKTNNHPAQGNKPDIYHFIFDGYTNSETLKKYWNYSNPIDSFLTNHGFSVIQASISNYDFTPFSLGSVFNMQYMAKAQKFLGRDGKNFYIGRMSFMENELFNILEANNYTLNKFSLLDSIKYLQRLGTLGPQKPINWMRNQTVERLYLNPWLRHKILHKFKDSELPREIQKNYECYADYHRRALDYFSKSVERRQEISTPNFYLIHFFLPHEPYVFDGNGNVNTQSLKADNMKGYLQQVQYANTVISKIVSHLQKDQKEKIVIIQGDHGYRITEAGMTQADQFATFNAIYFHDSDYKKLYKGFSLVNTYRLVLNKYFNYDLPLLKDSIFLFSR